MKPFENYLSVITGVYPGDKESKLDGTPEGTAIYFHHNDHLGSTRMMTDMSGNIIAEYEYFPFGETKLDTKGTVPQDFTGHVKDDETGLLYAGARYISPMDARFNSVDPARASISPMNPQSWNRYSYALNNPNKFIDPDGMWFRVASTHVGYSAQDVFSHFRTSLHNEDLANKFKLTPRNYVVFTGSEADISGNIYARMIVEIINKPQLYEMIFSSNTDKKFMEKGGAITSVFGYSEINPDKFSKLSGQSWDYLLNMMLPVPTDLSDVISHEVGHGWVYFFMDQLKEGGSQGEHHFHSKESENSQRKAKSKLTGEQLFRKIYHNLPK